MNNNRPDIEQIELAVCEADEPDPKPPGLIDRLKILAARRKVNEDLESKEPLPQDSMPTPEQEERDRRLQTQTAREMFEEFQLRRRETERTNPIYANPATGELYPSRAMREMQQLDPRLHPYMNAAAAGIIQQYSPGNMPMVLTSGSFHSNPTPEISLNALGQSTINFFLTDREGPQSEFDTLPEGVRQRTVRSFQEIPSEAFRLGRPPILQDPSEYEDNVRFGVILCVPREWMYKYIYDSGMGTGRTRVETNDVFSEWLAYYWMRFIDRNLDTTVRIETGLSPQTDCIEVCINSDTWHPGLAPVYMGDTLPKMLMDGRIVRGVCTTYTNAQGNHLWTGPR